MEDFNIHIISPFSFDKRLGKAYNDAMKIIPQDDWVIITDYDVCFLLPETIPRIREYILKYHDTALFCCYTNRIGGCASGQMCSHGIISEDDSFKYHIKLAEKYHERGIKATKIKLQLSGFLMVISKKTWDKYKFNEDRLCLGVDNDYYKQLLDNWESILRMDSVYVWHTYRLNKKIKDKSHLK
jgi:hypothetical protein